MNGDRNICLARMLQDATDAFPVGTLGLDKQKGVRWQPRQHVPPAFSMPEAAQEAKRCYQKWQLFLCQHNHKHEMQPSNWL